MKQRFVWCLIAASLVTGCSNDSSAGTPFAGNGSNHNCTTGTEIVLVNPVPGIIGVSRSIKTIEIASNAVILRVHAGLALGSPHSKPGPGHQLYGPVLPPTPTPSPAFTEAVALSVGAKKPPPTPTPEPTAPIPFPSPAFYKARGFRLEAQTRYAVYVSSVHGGCTPAAIPGAFFSTSDSHSGSAIDLRTPAHK
jgi:hypothetical protein